MSSQKEVIDHLIDIKTDIAVIKTQLSDLPNLMAEVKQNSHDILKAHTQVRTIKDSGRWYADVIRSNGLAD